MEEKPPILKLIQLLIDSPVQVLPPEHQAKFSGKLSSYAHKSSEAEKLRLITEMMELLWREGNSAQLLKYFANFERFLRAVGKRDHFIHQFEVYLLGWFIIHALEIRGYHIGEFTSLSSELFLQTWLMTAMGHDLGLPLQEEPAIIKVLKELHESVGTRTIAGNYAKLEAKLSHIGSKGRQILMKDLLSGEGSKIAHQIRAGIKITTGFSLTQTRAVWNTLVKSGKNHGLISAIILGRDLSGFFVPGGDFQGAEAADDPELKRFRLLLSAIALHHLKEEGDSEHVVKNIRFTANPFAYLLYIADNLQEWGRDIGGWANVPETTLTDFEFNDPKLTLTFTLSHDDWGIGDAEKNVLAEIRKADHRLKWPQRPYKGLSIEAIYNSNSKIINAEKITVEI